MIVLNYLDKFLKIENSFEISNSSREVTFSEIIVDFTGYSREDLPVKYQEIKILDVSEKNIKNNSLSRENVIFYGYLDSFRLPVLINNWSDVSLSLSLLSPYAITSLRTATVNGNYILSNLIMQILNPLINDGFKVKTLNVRRTNVKVSYTSETIENLMNKLSNKYNFWWYIDYKKNIYIEDLDNKFSYENDNVYTIQNIPRGLYSIQPSMDSIDYANTINFKNVRVYYPSAIWKYTRFNKAEKGYRIVENPLINLDDFDITTDRTITLKPQEEYTFQFPFDITVKNVEQCIDNSSNIEDDFHFPFYLAIGKENNDGNYEYSLIASINLGNGVLEYTNVDFVTNTESTAEILLIRDSFFSNLITGFKYNGTEQKTGILIKLISVSSLIWTKYCYSDIQEINSVKNKISKSGIVEKTIDLSQGWYFENELQSLAKSKISQNNNQTDKIELSFDEKSNWQIGDIINFNIEDFFVKGTYIVTDVDFYYENNEAKHWTFSLRNKNFLENFIDLFRNDEEDTNEDRYIKLLQTNSINETIKEVKEVI